VGKIARFELWSRELWAQHFEDESDARVEARRNAYRNLKR
jgi:DNA-binding transcriptional regulator/RsmH inhibitor MraZ